MRGLILGAWFLVLLLSFGFSAPESYPRPWDNAGWVAENEHIADLGFTQIWFVLEPTANISKWDALGLMVPFQESLEEAQVELLWGECTQGGCSAAGPLGSSVRSKQFADEAVRFTQLNQVFGGVTGVPVESIYAWNLFNYVENWKSAMGNALYAAETTGAEVNGKRAVLMQRIGQISRSGICDQDYAGPGAGICSGAVEDVACNGSGLWDPIPDMRWYPQCMRNGWATSAALDERHERINSQYADAFDQLEAMRAEVVRERAEAAAKSLLLSQNELGRITLGAESTDVGGVSSIRDEYRRANAAYAEANALMADAGPAADYERYGWYKIQYGALFGAHGKYGGFISSADALMEDARAVVERQKSLANADLAAAEGNSGDLTENGREHLRLAKNACAYADAETLLGPRFEKYGECRMHARIAVANLETENSTQLDVAAAEADSLIRKAEADGVDATTEKALLRIVRERKPASSLSMLSRIRDGLVEKAAQKYSQLPAERLRLLSMINGGGPQLAFLKTWLEGEGCYAGETLDYRCAIGSLASMEESYRRIDEEVLMRAGDAVGNALLIEYHESGTAASLRGESSYSMVVRARNLLGLGADNVLLEVPAGAELRKMDIADGQEKVRAVAYENGIATIQLNRIEAGETVVLEFSRNYTPCTASDYRSGAVGNANGGAEIVEGMDLSCSNRVGAIFVGDGIDSATLDGNKFAVSDGMLRAPISAGRHELELHSLVWDAYSIAMGQESAATIGTKTSVEYMLDIMPGMDLDYIPVIVDESEKMPSKLEVFAYTGERITNQKKLGNGAVYLELNGLEEGQLAKLKVRYEFSDSKEYAGQEIEALSGAGLSGAARSHLDNASALYAAGRYDEALSAIGMARAQMERDAKEWAKLLQKDRELRDEIGRKLVELNGAVGAAAAAGLDEAYAEEMRARAEYLGGMLARNLTATSTTSPLEEVDLGWEGKEITKIQKYLKDGEAKVKKEWMALGVDDANMSGAISFLEEKNAYFSGTMRLGDAVGALSALQKAKAALEAVKANQDIVSASEQNELHAAVEEAIVVLGVYGEERNSVPRGHSMAPIFKRSPSWIADRLAGLNRSDDVGAAISEAAMLRGEMEGVIKVLKGESERIGQTVGDLYNERGSSLGAESRNAVEEAVDSAETYYNQKHYAKAVLAYENALDVMENADVESLDVLILAATALLVIGIVTVLLLRGGKTALPLRGKGGHTKKLKKLPAEEDIE